MVVVGCLRLCISWENLSDKLRLLVMVFFCRIPPERLCTGVSQWQVDLGERDSCSSSEPIRATFL